jgi:hypothetical protein
MGRISGDCRADRGSGHRLDRHRPDRRQPRRLIVKRDREGFGVIRNLGLGLAGALVGGLLFRLLRLWPASTRSQFPCATWWRPS